MSELTFIRGQEILVSSERIAETMGVQHSSIMRLIKKYRDDFEDENLVGFEIQARLVGQHGGGDTEVAILDEYQATLLLTYMRNTEKVRAFKKALVRAFLDAKNLMMTTQMGLLQKRAILSNALGNEKSFASECGKGLSDWKEKRDYLQAAIERVDAELQPMLTGFDNEIKKIQG